MARPAPAIEYFYENINTATDECMIWPYGKTKAGYGTIHLDGRTCYVHRLACEAMHGPGEPGQIALHGVCHNPSCWNGRHLSWGTYADNNVRDRVRDGIRPGGSGRGRKGEKR